MKTTLPLIDGRPDTKLIIMSAWISLMCLYIYCDIYSLFRPGVLNSMLDGRMGFFDTTQLSLFLAACLMFIPSMMILLSVFTGAKLSRILNLVISPIFFLVNVGNLIAETWAYYYLFGLAELGLVVFIFIVSLRWPRQNA